MNSVVAPFTIQRTFSAPLTRVWRAWTDLNQFEQWFGPKGVVCVAVTRDFRPGGVFHYRMRSADGQENWGRCAYREIVPEEKLNVTQANLPAEGEQTRFVIMKASS